MLSLLEGCRLRRRNSIRLQYHGQFLSLTPITGFQGDFSIENTYSKVSFCPYSDTQYWTSLLTPLINKTSSLVTAFNLQCYAGGSGNEPSDWIFAIQQQVGNLVDAATMVIPG